MLTDIQINCMSGLSSLYLLMKKNQPNNPQANLKTNVNS